MTSGTAEDPDLSTQLRHVSAQIADALRQPDTDPTLIGEALRTAREELVVADEELRAQQEELDRLLLGQRHSRWAQERLISLLPAAVIVTDENGLIRSGNAAAAEMLGVRLDRLMRKPLFVYVSEEDRPVIRRMLARAVAEKAHELRMIVSLLVRGGETVSAELAATLERDTERPDGGLQAIWLLVAHTGLGGTGERRDSARLAQALAGITQLPLHSTSVQQTLTEISGLCQQAFTPSVAVSVTMGEPLAPDLVATDSKLAQTMDGAQIMAGEGPCQDAWERGATVSSADLSTESRWSRWRHSFQPDTMARSCIASPIRVADKVAGVLNIYSPAHGVPTGAALEAAELLATTVAAVLHEVDLRTELQGVADQLQSALQSRATIDQAKGIIMARHGCTAEEAFRVLADASSRSNVKLRVIAKRLVEETAHPAE